MIERFYEATPEREGLGRELSGVALQLGSLGADFARVYRAPRYSDSERESDAEHSYMLALVAPELANAIGLRLDLGKVTQFAIVHDLIELRTGDVPTFQLTHEELAAKELTEQAALEQLLAELPPHTSKLLADYEQQDTKEARFVRAVDKLLPLIVNAIGDGVRVMSEDYGVDSHTALMTAHDKLHSRIQQKFGEEFPEITMAHAILCELFETLYLAESSQTSHEQPMTTEIERKFYIEPNRIPDDLEPLSTQKIRQGYLAVAYDGSETRLRCTDDNRYELTIKSSGAMERSEQTTQLTKEMFDALWPQTDGRRIDKVRQRIPCGDYTIELDLFEGQLTGLVTAEVEFANRSQALGFSPPSWFSTEITHDPRYKNRSLALYQEN